MSIPIKGNMEIDRRIMKALAAGTLVEQDLTDDVLRNLGRNELRELIKYFDPLEHSKIFRDILYYLDIRSAQSIGGLSGTILAEQSKMIEDITNDVFDRICEVMENVDSSEKDIVPDAHDREGESVIEDTPLEASAPENDPLEAVEPETVDAIEADGEMPVQEPVS